MGTNRKVVVSKDSDGEYQAAINLSTGVELKHKGHAHSPEYILCYAYVHSTGLAGQFLRRKGTIEEFMQDYNLNLIQGSRTLALGDWCVLLVPEDSKTDALFEYEVVVSRTSYANRAIAVTACCEVEARKKAYEVCGNYVYTEYESEYDIDSVRKL